MPSIGADVGYGKFPKRNAKFFNGVLKRSIAGVQVRNLEPKCLGSVQVLIGAKDTLAGFKRHPIRIQAALYSAISHSLECDFHL